MVDRTYGWFLSRVPQTSKPKITGDDYKITGTSENLYLDQNLSDW